MKTIILLFLVVITTAVNSQTKEYTGTYKRDYDINGEGVNKYTLDLKPNGTFIFHNYRKISTKNPEENQYGKGTWKSEKNNVIYFYTNKETELDEKHTLNFTNTKARFITKSPRDKSDKEVKTHLRFYDSEIFWIKGHQLFKN
tara:strand:+ start:7070 stop:7498 length:429 start_codon:yes stop_codon:yes gene_type:complete